jgi:hypothetical protein
MNKLHRTAALVAFGLMSGAAFAKLPPPSDEAKAKAAEAAAKTAHGNKVADFQLCKSMNATAAFYFASAKKAGKDTKAATATPECADPGAFVYPPPAAGAAPAAAAPATAAAKPAAKPAAPAAPPKKT